MNEQKKKHKNRSCFAAADHISGADRYLPTSVKEMKALGWDHVDVVIFSSDAYVDHPSFGAAVIGRTLRAAPATMWRLSPAQLAGRSARFP